MKTDRQIAREATARLRKAIAQHVKDKKALEKDAARYRFLRNQPILTGAAGIGPRQVYVTVSDWAKNLGSKNGGPWSSMPLNGMPLDAEIDRAMKTRRKSR